nr:MAG TPA: putative GntR-family transcriptional regulator [Caudoviricetes sp.]
MAKQIIKKKKKVMPDLLPPGAMSDISKVCGCSRKTVYNALRRQYKGIISDKVRAYVVEKYGVEKD